MEPNDPISLGDGTTPADPLPPIDLYSNTQVPPTPAEADERAKKYNFALGPDSPGFEVLKQSVISGVEDKERERAVANHKLKMQQIRNGLVNDYMKTIPPGQQRPEDIATIEALSGATAQGLAKSNPKTVFEQMYAERLLGTALTADKSPLNESMQENENKTHQIIDAGESAIAGKEIAQKLLEELEKEQKSQGWAAYAADIGKQIIPGYSWYSMHGNLPSSSFLLGNNMKEQALNYYLLPNDQKEQFLKDGLAKIRSGVAGGNLDLAITWLHTIANFSGSDELWGNIFSILDLSAPVPGVGITTKRTYERLFTRSQRMFDATRDIARSVAGRTADPVAVADAAGDIASASAADAAKKLQQGAKASTWEDMKGEMKALFDPEAPFVGNPHHMSAERTQRMIARSKAQAEELQKMAFGDKIDIQRLEPGNPAFEAAVRNTDDLFNKQYPHLADNVLDLTPDNTSHARVEIRHASSAQQKALEKELAEVTARGKFQEYTDFEMVSHNLDRTVQALVQLGRDTGIAVGSLEKIGQRAKAASHFPPEFISKFKAELSGYATQIVNPVVKADVDRIIAATHRSLDAIASMKPEDVKLYTSIRYRNQFIRENVVPPKPLGEVEKAQGNVDYLVKLIGDKDAQLFDNPASADFHAKDIYKLKDYEIRPKGAGYAIAVRKAIDETAFDVREALKTETNGSTPRSFMNTLNSVLSIRSKEYTLPGTIAGDFNVATYGASQAAFQLKHVLDKSVSYLPNQYSISRLWRKESRKDFTDFIDRQRMADNGTGTPGKFSAHQAEFEQEWLAQHGRLPTDNESFAYWSLVRIYNMDYGLTNLGILRDKSRMGWEMFSFGKIDGVEAKVPSIEGKFLKELPEHKQDAGVLVLDKDSKNWQYMRTKAPQTIGGVGMGPREIEAIIKDKIDSGYKLVQITDFGEEEFRKIGPMLNGGRLPDGKIHFILSQDLDTAQLPMAHIPNRPGFHHAYTAQAYIRQPKVVDSGGYQGYFGDRNIWGFEDLKEARTFTDRLNTARLMLKDVYAGSKTDAELEAYLRKNLPFSIGKFKQEFDPTRNGKLNINVPFFLTDANTNVARSTNLRSLFPNLIDETQSELNMYRAGINLQNAAERGDTLMTVATTGTKENPIFNQVPAKMLDATATMDRAATSLMRGRYLEDLKFKTAERFIAEFGDLIDRSPQVMRTDPIRYLFGAGNEFPWIKSTDTAEKLAAAKNYRRAALEFFNLKTDSQRFYDYTKAKLGQMLFKQEKLVQGEPWLVTQIASPVDRVKSAVFDARMSFSPMQLFLQAQSLANVAGIEGPVRAIKTYPAAAMAQFLRYYDFWSPKLAKVGIGQGGTVTTETQRHVASIVSTGSTWKPQHFIEAYQGLRASGFGNVGREIADQADFMTPRITPSTIGYVMDWGRTFFRIGERFSRDSAYFAAYDRWRMANPHVVFDNEAQKQVLARASLLNNDMSAASAATWQRGFTGITTQFLPYQVRLFEQLTGGRLTVAEKMRMTAVQMSLYGAGVAGGAWLLGAPLAQWIREAQLEKGFDVDDNWLIKFFNEGLPSIAIELATGGKKNFGERYGPGNFTLMSDLLTGDKSAFELAFGITGSTFKDTIKAMEPFLVSWTSAWDPNSEFIVPKMEDFKNVLTSFSTGLNNADKILIAINTGEYLTKRGIKVDKMNNMEIFTKALFGLDPMRISDMYKKIENEKDHAALKKRMEPFIAKEFRTALKAWEDNDPAAGHQAFIRMKAFAVWGGYRMDELPELHKRIISGYESRLDQVNRRYAFQSPEKLKLFMKELERTR